MEWTRVERWVVDTEIGTRVLEILLFCGYVK